jgi:hypothetical protein
MLTREFVYQLDADSNGISEILAINDREFLVLERDGKAGAEAAFKKLFRIDLTNATDVSAVTLPQKGQPEGVVPAAKNLFLDLLDPAYKLAGATFPAKLEGLAFGPDLPDGRHLLLVVNDNDLSADNPSCVYAFAVDVGDLPNFQKFERTGQ